MERIITIREFFESYKRLGIRCDTTWRAEIIIRAFDMMRKKHFFDIDSWKYHKENSVYVNDGSCISMLGQGCYGIKIYEFDEVVFNMDFSGDEYGVYYPQFIATTSNLNNLFNNNWFELSKPRKGSNLFSIICDKFSMPSKDIRIKGVYPNKEKKLVVVKWCDDTITKVACSKDDEFDLYIGVALAISYKMNGSNTQFRKYVDKLTHWQVEKKKKPKEEVKQRKEIKNATNK